MSLVYSFISNPISPKDLIHKQDHIVMYYMQLGSPQSDRPIKWYMSQLCNQNSQVDNIREKYEVPQQQQQPKQQRSGLNPQSHTQKESH